MRKLTLERSEMQEVDACKFGELKSRQYRIGCISSVYCEKGRKSSNRCLTKGRPECVDYKRLIVLTAEEMRQKIEEERNGMA